MDRSIPSLTNPAESPHGERRRCIRQKLHTPVYASFNGPQTGMVVDLSELLDLNEDGFAVQTSQRLDVNRAVTVCLDLPETKSYIHSTGQVIWSDDTGRGGIRFSGLPEKSRQVLKEWLFANLLIGSSNHVARTVQLAARSAAESAEATPVAKAPSIVPVSDGSAIISAVEAVRLVVRDIGDDLDAILQLVAERALSFTGASGAALAFLTDDKMICRARAGEMAPPLETPVDVTQGLTGECVRSGVLVSCEDTENDPRVDPEVCRIWGIGSLMAAPIVDNLQVIGLLEVFSPHPRSFTDVHRTVLERLVELIPKPRRHKTQIDGTPPAPAGPEGMSGASPPPASGTGSMQFASIQTTNEAFCEPEPEVLGQAPPHIGEEIVSEEISEHLPEPAPQAPRLVYRALLGLAIGMVFVVVGYLIAPVIDKRWAVSPQASQRSSSETGSAASGQSTTDLGPQAKFLTDLRKLAEQGNAEAQWQLGARYHSGEGVPRDDVQAMQWFQRAAEQGHPTAQATLGAYYWAGRGVPQDLSKAYFWSTLALAQGDENSKSRLEGLATQMTQEQVSAARQQAEVWIHTHTDRAKSAAN
jgi:putative methionine-R-sulfoxide reductase with GAF domain